MRRETQTPGSRETKLSPQHAGSSQEESTVSLASSPEQAHHLFWRPADKFSASNPPFTCSSWDEGPFSAQPAGIYKAKTLCPAEPRNGQCRKQRKPQRPLEKGDFPGPVAGRMRKAGDLMSPFATVLACVSIKEAARAGNPGDGTWLMSLGLQALGKDGNQSAAGCLPFLHRCP